MPEVVIVSALRTAVGSFGGSLKNIPAVDLGAAVIKAAVEEININKEEISEVIMGNVLQAGLGQNPARQASIKAGIPDTVPALTINDVCGSGLRAINLAAQAINAGDGDIYVVGGMENMSQAPYVNNKARWGKKMGNSKLIDVMIKDGLWCPFNDYHMGITAENIAEKWNISREKQDEFALSSQNKAFKAQKDGKFKAEIIPVKIPQRKGEPLIFKDDEYIREKVTIDKLAKLSPAFKKDGSVTAGNASGLNDGAAALVIMSKAKADELGIEVKAKIKSYASAGVDPSIMGTGPIPATKKALAKTNLNINELDLIELNEAFASQSLAVIEELDLSKDIINVNGGAIAIGHPIGASGTRILITLLYEMEKRKSKYGLATLCIGGGQGEATILER